MAYPLLAEPPPSPSIDNNPNNYTSDFDSLQIPLDSFFFSDYDANNSLDMSSDPLMSDFGIGLGLEENGDFELTFDDLDDLYLPSENEVFLLPGGFDHITGSLQPFMSSTDQPVQMETDAAKGSNFQLPGNGFARVSYSQSQESDNSVVSGEKGSRASDHLKCPLSDSGNFSLENSPPNSDDYNLNASKELNFSSPEHGGSDHELSGGTASSQGSGSGNFGSGVSEEMNNPPPDSDNYDVTVDQKIKLEGTGKTCAPKRKNEQDEGNTESRTTKYRRSSISIDNDSQSFGAEDDEEEKRKARLMRNRESAQLSRQRKKHYVEELEDKVRGMHSTIADLNSRISYIMAENASLRQQLSGGGMCQPPPGMYPHPPVSPMAYPWMPCPPYVVKQQGSQVPLVPIPRLKPQQPVSTKAKKNEVKKVEGKTKKVASVSFLGVLCFILLFGGLVPIVNVKFGGTRSSGVSGYFDNNNIMYEQHHGRVLRVNSYFNRTGGRMSGGTPYGKFNISGRVRYRDIKNQEMMFGQNEQAVRSSSDSEEFIHLRNSSEPLVASLYVPRNNKLVKIDGNLIIHSVLASEEAMASRNPGAINKRETSLALTKDMTPALTMIEATGNRGRRPNIYRNPAERQKALTSRSSDTLKNHMKSTAADGKLQQWFREGLAGPMLSSGMCTEVFQFDVSPASAAGAIIPASSVPNASAEHRQNATQLNKNRRILNGLPVPLADSNFNITEEHVGRNPRKDNFQGNKSVSSMEVSVLIDPREGGDGEVDGMMGPKSLSRIFVVVLLDSVKYVTYSCMLPRSGLHIVTA